MPGSDPVVSIDQMKAAIGTLIILWSGIERELTESIRSLDVDGTAPPAHGISRRLDLWSSLVLRGATGRARQTQLCHSLGKYLKDALVVRNFVCHGIVGIQAQFYESCPEAHLTAELGNERRILTLSELSAIFENMANGTRLIGNLTGAAMAMDVARSDGFLVDWEAFPRTGRPARRP